MWFDHANVWQDSIYKYQAFSIILNSSSRPLLISFSHK
jgi:hypothetical protein